jgi:signal transduction histidine kinase
MQRHPSSWKRYGAALVFTCAALVLKLLLVPLVTHDEPVLLFLAAVMVSAAVGGLGPGLLSTLLGTICDAYFFMAPYVALRLNGADQEVRLGIFLLEGIFISVISARLKAAHHQAERSANESRELQKHILEIADAEQQRLGHDLHDGLGQHLTGIALLARRFQQRLEKIAPSEAADAVTLSGLAQSAVEWTHDLCRTLSPTVPESADLPTALQELAAKAQSMLKVECTVEQVGDIATVSWPSRLHMYRIAQEAINNAVRHGQASHVRLQLRGTESELKMQIWDDGTGFGSSPMSKDGMGLRIMQYRARMIGAEFDIRYAPTGGTVVTCLCNVEKIGKSHVGNGHE